MRARQRPSWKSTPTKPDLAVLERSKTSSPVSSSSSVWGALGDHLPPPPPPPPCRAPAAGRVLGRFRGGSGDSGSWGERPGR